MGQGPGPRYLCPRLHVFQPPRFAVALLPPVAFALAIARALYEFMFSRNFLFVFVSLILLVRNSIASTGLSSLRNLRRIHTRASVSGDMSNSSLRVWIL